MQSYKTCVIVVMICALSFVVLVEHKNKDNECTTKRFESKSVTNVDAIEFLKKHVQEIKNVCGDVCRTEEENTKIVGKGKYYNHVEKSIDCQRLFENLHITDYQEELFRPLKKIPSFMMDDYSYQGRLPLLSNYMDDSHGFSHQRVWTKELLNKERTKFREGKLGGSYGQKVVQRIDENARNLMNISGSQVLVIGSQRPWLEAILLELGAKKVTTLEYVKIRSEVSEIDILTPSEMGEAYLSGKLPEFDAVVTFSSIEHSGLGRYGDSLNPFADLITMARTWCVTKKGGRALVGVPTGPDQVLFNAAKIYGPLQYSHLFANWRQIHSTADYSKYSTQCKYCYQPLHIIEK